ncbi:membrane protein [Tamlana sedimentorum]|uniref:Membrane protein n=1 Tax=Neotamlana sedimentorum TaxID=1435349 RepID=A0A0D7WF19_9FLAO|nr:hypothetical protein [Tamlana sedimentorum]KJD36332.1 membrane protein [Tamlana sedimentorum]
MIKKDVIIGIIVGLVANTIGLILAAMLLGGGDDFTAVIKAAISEGFLGKLISLGAILNLIAFFVFIRKRQDYKARGVLLITVILAVCTFIFKIF